MTKSHSNLTIKVPATVGNVFTVSAGSGGSGGILNNGSYSYNSNWASSAVNVQSGLKVSGDAAIDGDLTIQGISIIETLQKIQERLAILVPDPKLVDKYAALKEAYEQYKTLEALCMEYNADRTEK
jgi:hypothetical protein